MPIYLRVLFLVVVSGVGVGLSAYTLSRLGFLIESAAQTQILSTVFTLDLVEITETIQMIKSTLHTCTAWVSSAGLMICYFLVGTSLPARGLRWLGWLSGGWMGYVTLLLSFGGLSHLIEWSLISPLAPAYGPAWSLLTLIVIHLAWPIGLWSATRPPALAEVEVNSSRIGPELDGLRIVQLSDVHIGPTVGIRFVEHLHERCVALKPDLIVMTGDLVDGATRYLGAEVSRFLELRELAPRGMYMITGNHEYISGARSWVEYVKARGVTVLENAAETITVGDSALHLIGVEDWDAERFDRTREPSLERALAGLPEGGYRVLLAHQPKAAPEASALGIDLQLSGHTHGGQIFPLTHLIYIDQPYNVGRYQVGDLTLYVNPGTGYWGPPLRLGTRAEITLITLRSTRGA